jgi:hypothetical protein
MKRSRITIETRQLLAIRSPRGLVHAWCPACGEQVPMLRAEQAAALAGVSLRAICSQVDAGTLHFTEQTDGLLFICFNSLLPSIQS